MMMINHFLYRQYTAPLTSLSTIFNLLSTSLAASYKKRMKTWRTQQVHKHTHTRSSNNHIQVTDPVLTLLPWLEYFFTESASPWTKRRSTFSYSVHVVKANVWEVETYTVLTCVSAVHTRVYSVCVRVTCQQSRRASLQLRFLPLQSVCDLFVLMDKVRWGIPSRLSVLSNLRDRRNDWRDLHAFRAITSIREVDVVDCVRAHKHTQIPFSPAAPCHSWGGWSCGICTVEESCWDDCSCHSLHVWV